jgi:ATP-dependent Lon protease
MGSGSQGDPRSELLEILDPNQNSSFVDNYIDLPIDLSNVLFVCSANYERNISKPLLDRMEKIRLNSYTDDEKK